MKKGLDRSPVSVVLLSIITCGIYSLYWMYIASKEIDEAGGEQSSAGTNVLLTLVTCGIYGIYWYYKYSQKIVDLCNNYGVSVDKNMPIIGLVLSICEFGIVQAAIMQSAMNNLWKSVN